MTISENESNQPPLSSSPPIPTKPSSIGMSLSLAAGILGVLLLLNLLPRNKYVDQAGSVVVVRLGFPLTFKETIKTNLVTSEALRYGRLAEASLNDGTELRLNRDTGNYIFGDGKEVHFDNASLTKDIVVAVVIAAGLGFVIERRRSTKLQTTPQT